MHSNEFREGRVMTSYTRFRHLYFACVFSGVASNETQEFVFKGERYTIWICKSFHTEQEIKLRILNFLILSSCLPSAPGSILQRRQINHCITFVWRFMYFKWKSFFRPEIPLEYHEWVGTQAQCRTIWILIQNVALLITQKYSLHKQKRVWHSY